MHILDLSGEEICVVQSLDNVGPPDHDVLLRAVRQVHPRWHPECIKFIALESSSTYANNDNSEKRISSAKDGCSYHCHTYHDHEHFEMKVKPKALDDIRNGRVRFRKLDLSLRADEEFVLSVLGYINHIGRRLCAKEWLRHVPKSLKVGSERVVRRALDVFGLEEVLKHSSSSVLAHKRQLLMTNATPGDRFRSAVSLMKGASERVRADRDMALFICLQNPSTGGDSCNIYLHHCKLIGTWF